MTNLSMYRGDTGTVTVTVSNLPTTGLTGYRYWLTVKHNISDADNAAFIQKLPAAFTVVTNGSDTVPGVLTCQLLPADTSSLTDYPTQLFYDVQLEDGSGVVTTVCSGILIVTPDITRSA